MKSLGCFSFFLLITFFSAAASIQYEVFQENGKVGLKDADGLILIPAQYQSLGWSDGRLSVINNVTGFKLNELWGLITIKNHKLTQPTYSELIPAEGNMLLARKKSNLSLRNVQGCITVDGKELIPFQYDGIKLASLRAIVYTKVSNQYRYGLIDLNNRIIISQQYKDIRSIGSLRYAVDNFDRKTALFADNGKQITGFTIDSISVFKKNFAIIYQGVLQGLIDREGQVKIEPTCREIQITNEGKILGRSADEWLMIDGKNQMIRKTNADDIVSTGKNQLKVTQAGKVALTDLQFAASTSMTLNAINEFYQERAIIISLGKQGLIDRQGKIIIEPVFDKLIQDRKFLLANTRQMGSDRWSLLDSLGKKISAKSYDLISSFNGEYYAVKQRGYWGAINFAGKEVLPCTYDSLLQAKGNLIVVKFRGQYGIMNLNDEWMVTPRANEIKLIAENRFVEFSPKTIFLKSIDNQVIYFTDNKVTWMDGHIVETLPSGTTWKIDMNGRIIDRKVHPDEPIEQIFEETEGLRGIKKDGKFGFIDSKGRLRIANRYENIKAFSEELAPAMIRGRWGYINHADNIAIQPIYEEVSGFKNGYAQVKQKGFYGLINKQGVQVLPVRYESISTSGYGNLLIRQDTFFGLADAKGKTLIHPRYHALEDVGNGFAIVMRDGKYGVVTYQSVSTIPMIYDLITYDRFNDVFFAMKKSSWVEL
jgi:WG containing repeat